MVTVFLADGFEEIEALTPVDYLRRAGITVQTVGVTGLTVTGRSGITVQADIPLSDFSTQDVEMIVLPGGLPGATNLEESEKVQESIDYCVENNIYVAAICAAPSILGHKGLLKGRKATAFGKFTEELTGADIQPNGVYQDGVFITASSVHYAGRFAYQLVEALRGPEAVQELKKNVLDPTA